MSFEKCSILQRMYIPMRFHFLQARCSMDSKETGVSL